MASKLSHFGDTVGGNMGPIITSVGQIQRNRIPNDDIVVVDIPKEADIDIRISTFNSYSGKVASPSKNWEEISYLDELQRWRQYMAHHHSTPMEQQMAANRVTPNEPPTLKHSARLHLHPYSKSNSSRYYEQLAYEARRAHEKKLYSDYIVSRNRAHFTTEFSPESLKQACCPPDRYNGPGCGEIGVFKDMYSEHAAYQRNYNHQAQHDFHLRNYDIHPRSYASQNVGYEEKFQDTYQRLKCLAESRTKAEQHHTPHISTEPLTFKRNNDNQSFVMSETLSAKLRERREITRQLVRKQCQERIKIYEEEQKQNQELQRQNIILQDRLERIRQEEQHCRPLEHFNRPPPPLLFMSGNNNENAPKPTSPDSGLGSTENIFDLFEKEKIIKTEPAQFDDVMHQTNPLGECIDTGVEQGAAGVSPKLFDALDSTEEGGVPSVKTKVGARVIFTEKASIKKPDWVNSKMASWRKRNNLVSTVDDKEEQEGELKTKRICKASNTVCVVSGDLKARTDNDSPLKCNLKETTTIGDVDTTIAAPSPGVLIVDCDDDVSISNSGIRPRKVVKQFI